MSFLIDMSQIDRTGIDAAILALNGDFLPKSGGIVSGDINILGDMSIYGEINTYSGVIFDGQNKRIGVGVSPQYKVHIGGNSNKTLYLGRDGSESKIIMSSEQGDSTGCILCDESGNVSIEHQRGRNCQISIINENSKIFSADEEIEIGTIINSGAILFSGLSVTGINGEIDFGEIDNLNYGSRYYQIFINRENSNVEKIDLLVSRVFGKQGISIITGYHSWKPEYIFESGAGYYEYSELPIIPEVTLESGKRYFFEVSGIDPCLGGLYTGDSTPYSGLKIFYDNDEISSIPACALITDEDSRVTYDFMYTGAERLFSFEDTYTGGVFSGEKFNIDGVVIGHRNSVAYESGNHLYILTDSGNEVFGSFTKPLDVTAGKQYFVTGDSSQIMRFESEIDEFYSGDFTIYLKRIGKFESGYFLRSIDRDVDYGARSKITMCRNDDWGYHLLAEQENGLNACSFDFSSFSGYQKNQILILDIRSGLFPSGSIAEYAPISKNYSILAQSDDGADLRSYSTYGTEIILQSGSLCEFGLVRRLLTDQEKSGVLESTRLLDIVAQEDVAFLFKIDSGAGDTIYDIINGYTGVILDYNEDFWI